MQRGWDASKQIRGFLKIRKEAGLEGWTQEWLAATTGIGRSTINAYCAPVEKKKHHRDIGQQNAALIATALDVSVLDLGAPDEEADEPGVLLLARLQSIEETAVKPMDLGRAVSPLREAIRLLANGDSAGALRVLSEEAAP